MLHSWHKKGEENIDIKNPPGEMWINFEYLICQQFYFQFVFQIGELYNKYSR
jgi:hypothetical protein